MCVNTTESRMPVCRELPGCSLQLGWALEGQAGLRAVQHPGLGSLQCPRAALTPRPFESIF